jgi:hypothetical protein
MNSIFNYHELSLQINQSLFDKISNRKQVRLAYKRLEKKIGLNFLYQHQYLIRSNL